MIANCSGFKLFGVVSDYVVKDGNLLIAESTNIGNQEIAAHDDVVGDYAEQWVGDYAEQW